MRIFSGFVSVHSMPRLTLIERLQDSVQPPLLLSLALPHLPKPLPSIIMHGLGYMQLAGAILNDLAAAVVAVGLFIAASHLYQNWSLS